MLKIYMLKTFLKFIFAFGLIYWLIHSGRLDFSLVKKSIQNGYYWLIAICFLICQFILGVFRYKTLLEIKSSKPIPFLSLAKINWIGVFFSSILPGAVTGDLVKLVYVKKLDHGLSKTFLITATLIDRIVGLTGLLFLSGLFSILYFGEISKISPEITHIIYLDLFLFLGALTFFAILLAPIRVQNIFLWPLPLKIRSKLHQVFSLRESKKEILKCFLLSVACQFLGVLAFWTVTSPFYNTHLPLHYVFTFIPIGLIAVAIPISPGGLGVGHVLFANLFSIVKITNGASLFNLFFLCSISVNILGVIPYLLIRTKPTEKELMEFE